MDTLQRVARRRPRLAWLAAVLATLTCVTLFTALSSGSVRTEKSERLSEGASYRLPSDDILVDAGYDEFPHQYGIPRLWRLLPEAHKVESAELRDWVADTVVRAWMGKQEKRMDAYLKRKEMIVIEVDDSTGEGEGMVEDFLAMADTGRSLQHAGGGGAVESTGGGGAVESTGGGDSGVDAHAAHTVESTSDSGVDAHAAHTVESTGRSLTQLPVPATVDGGSGAGAARPENIAFRPRRTFHLARVVSVWEQPCRMHGSHFLVHTWMEDEGGDQRQVFLELDDAQQPGMPPLRVRERRVDPLTVVNFVVPIFNKWAELRRMLQGFHNLVTKKEEHSFRVIIVDYSSTDADVETEVNNYVSKLSVGRFEVIYKRLEGKFAKTVALQAGLELIPNHYEIFFSLDVDMELPLSFVDLVRRHTVRGKQVFAPIVMREPESRNMRDAWWEPTGVGMVGVFKSDALAVGYDVERFNTDWGWEDWNFVLRLWNHRLDIWRAKVRGFVHKFHAKNDWGG